MDRKLLPYEHQLIEALGVTKEEYLNFVDIQREYQDPKVGTVFDIRCDPATQATVALVLTVIGILFQVGAALLAPKPQVPSAKGNRRTSREERFAPTFGFNSAQELAVYNDPVNLVYTNKAHNNQGGVRLAGSLVWSELESFGSSQYMTMLLVLGASTIKQIEPGLTAFGQIAIKDLDPSLTWLFFDELGSGPARFKHIVFGIPQGKEAGQTKQKIEFLPPSLKTRVEDNTRVARLRPVSIKNAEKGFSQAYTPSTAIAFGAYDPVPIFVNQTGRQDDGDEKDAPNGVSIKGLDDESKTYPGQGSFFDIGDTVTFKFKDNSDRKGEDFVAEKSASLREQYIDSLDFGATYMLGTAKFRLKNIESNDRDNLGDRSIENRNAFFEFECIERGQKPSTPYNSKDSLDSPASELSLSIYVQARNRLQGNATEQAKFNVTGFGLGYNFSRTDTVKWKDRNGENQEQEVERGGSIEYTKKLRNSASNNPPKLKTAETRKQIRKQLRQQEDLIEQIRVGEYDVYRRAPAKTDYARALSNRIKKEIKKDAVLKALRKQEKEQKLKQVEVEQSNKNKKRKQKLLNAIEETLQIIREEKRNREAQVIKRQRRPFINLVRNSTKEHTAIDGKTYIAGTKQLENLLSDTWVANGLIIDQKGADAINDFYDNLIDEKEAALDQIIDLISDWDNKIVGKITAQRNKSFFTKCLVKVESGSYETVSEIDIVKFSLKATVFRRISGRRRKYGERKEKSFSDADNGLKPRSAYFRVKYKRVQDAAYNVFPVVFAVRHGSESSLYSQLNFEPIKRRQRWQFKFEPVFDLIAELRHNGQKGVGFIESEGANTQTETEDDVTWAWFGRKVYGIAPDGNPLAYQGTEKPEKTFEHAMFSSHSDTQVQFSFNNGPEFILAGVTEQQIRKEGDGSEARTEILGSRYKGMSTMALIVRAGRGIEDLRSVTAYVEKGKSCYIVPNRANQLYERNQNSSSYAPDIFADTAIDKLNGVGKYAPIVYSGTADDPEKTADASNVLDTDALIQAKNFCKNNRLPVQKGEKVQLFFDGIIADITSWREFWITNAPFSLLEFVRKNGREALVPAIPTDSSGRAAENDGRPVPLQISALFTTGNILEGSYKEEFLDYGPTTQDLIATVIYRETTVESVFDKQATVQVKLNDVDGNNVVRETFDTSTFVTQKEQAIMIGKLLVNQRRHIRRGIEFKTFPSQDPLEPGAFIYVDVGNTSWDAYSSGVVMDGGELNIPLHDKVGNGYYNFLLFDHKSGTTLKLNNKQVIDKKANDLFPYAGWMFVMGFDTPSKRVFRITEVSLDEEGEVLVKAMEYPCDNELRAEVADFRKSKFDVS